MTNVSLCVHTMFYRVTFEDAPLPYLKEIDIEWTPGDNELRVIAYAPGNKITEDCLHFYCSAMNIVRDYVNRLPKQGGQDYVR